MFAKIITVAYRGKHYNLAYNAWAMFRIQDISKDREIMDILARWGTEEFPLFCQAVQIMSEAAENIRQYEGGKRGEVLEAELILHKAWPPELLDLKRAALEAVSKGYQREIEDEEEEIDLGLAELQKKTD